MFFFIKKSKFVVDCFTDSVTAFERAKIDFASKFLPDWWKKLPKDSGNSFYPMPTMKTCVGVINLYKSGIIVPMWSELAIKVGRSGTEYIEWQYADLCSIAETHSAYQYNNYYPIKKYAHLKLNSPWLINYSKNINTFWSQPTFNMESLDDYTVLPGVVNSNTCSSVNINLFFTRSQQEDKTVFINFNQPMIHIVPLTESEIELKHHLVSGKEIQKRLFRRTHFFNSYSKQHEQKCPFHNESKL
jgi:hypothetical protein